MAFLLGRAEAGSDSLKRCNVERRCSSMPPGSVMNMEQVAQNNGEGAGGSRRASSATVFLRFDDEDDEEDGTGAGGDGDISSRARVPFLPLLSSPALSLEEDCSLTRRP